MVKVMKHSAMEIFTKECTKMEALTGSDNILGKMDQTIEVTLLED